MYRWTPLFGGCAVGLITLAACSPPAPNPATDSPSANAGASTISASAPPPSTPPTTITELPKPSALATDELTDVVCTADPSGSWSFSGILKNDSSAPVKYTVAVAVGTNSSPAGHALIEKTVAPGANEKVNAANFASGAPSGSTCEAVVSK